MANKTKKEENVVDVKEKDVKDVTKGATSYVDENGNVVEVEAKEGFLAKVGECVKKHKCAAIGIGTLLVCSVAALVVKRKLNCYSDDDYDYEYDCNESESSEAVNSEE